VATQRANQTVQQAAPTAAGATVEVDFRHVDIVFGPDPKPALELLDQGAERDAILERTGHVIGVADANVSIEAGEICVLMGLSGSGKSTLLRCVNGLNKATRGKVLVDDRDGPVDVTRCDPATLRRLRTQRIAMVFQQFALLPWRTVAENVGFGLELRGMSKPERDKVVAEKLRLVNLDQWKDKYAHELSGGMQQRVGLARAFATDADILLMDEPFSALDPLIRSRLQDELLELQRTLRKTIIFVSHDLDEAMKLGTHVSIMESGRIVQYGQPEDIVLNPASDYVKDFVAHMNPLNVLTGASLMTPVAAIARKGGDLLLDAARDAVMTLDHTGHPASVTIAGKRRRLVPLPDGSDFTGLDRSVVVTAPPDIKLKTALEVRHKTGNPLALVADGRLIGVIGDDEIYRGILRQTGIAEGPVAERDPLGDT
jgi:glycine betaine/proline transport system ATP-binding protein